MVKPLRAPWRTAVGVSLVISAGACGATSPSTSGATQPSATGAGFYTAAQANRGEQVFNSSCAGCHTSREFSGRLFQIGWAGRSVGEFYTLIRSTMPFDQPGRLAEQQYADVVAYVLRLNGHPEGAQELPPEVTALEPLRFEQGSSPGVGTSRR